MSRKIPLKYGTFVLVDNEDYYWLDDYEWFLSGPGYAAGFVTVNGTAKLTYMHRLILKAKSDQRVDHVNGNPLDNRRENLRFATPQQNGQNRRLSTLSKTGLKGVGWHKLRCKYHARIQLQGIRCHLGFFKDAETAALAYDTAARRLFGEFARVNYPKKEAPHWVEVSVKAKLKQHGLIVR